MGTRVCVLGSLRRGWVGGVSSRPSPTILLVLLTKNSGIPSCHDLSQASGAP